MKYAVFYSETPPKKRRQRVLTWPFPHPCLHGSAGGRLRAELPAALGPAASQSIITTQRPRRARHLINAVVGLISSECVMPRRLREHMAPGDPD